MIKETLAQAFLSAALLGFSLLIGLTGLGFLVAGLYLGLTHWLTSAAAAAVTGGIILFVSLLSLLASKAIMTPGKKKPREPEHSEPPDNLSALMQDAAALRNARDHLASTIQQHKPLITATTFAAGFYLGVNPGARRALSQALAEASSQQFGKSKQPH
ncbi:MAG: phage holin family protein [Oleiphilaceae bacterium]|nr:phage holin family protein [Oleiphilaceae bacterium]